MTEAERKRQKLVLDYCRVHGYPTPRTEFRFAPPRQFAFDFAFVAYKVAIEIDGGMFGIGPRCPRCKQRRVAGHSSIERRLSDLHKKNLAAQLGWRMAFFTPEMVDTGGEIWKWLDGLFTPPKSS